MNADHSPAHCLSWSERSVDGKRAWWITCSCGETWLRPGSLERSLEILGEIHPLPARETAVDRPHLL